MGKWKNKQVELKAETTITFGTDGDYTGLRTEIKYPSQNGVLW